jgi:hypothetical protein
MLSNPFSFRFSFMMSINFVRRPGRALARLAALARRGGWHGFCLLVAFLCLTPPLIGGPRSLSDPTPEPKAPPVAPPPLERSWPGPGPRSPVGLAGALTQYSIGEPTDEEQYLVELINRARRDPAAEGQRLVSTANAEILKAYAFFHVDTNLMFTAIAAVPPAPPLSINAKLIAAARGHTVDMFTNTYQGHDGTDGSSTGQRVTAAGYVWQSVRENVYSFATGLDYAHAGFEVDWGNGPGGMQNPPGHRNSIHTAAVREIGVGVSHGTQTGTNGTTVGPILITQDFAAQFDARAFVTGVAYYDLNQNGLYDVGEGIGGVRVDVANANAFAITANSGGFSVPVPHDGPYAVTFSGGGLSPMQTSVTVGNTNNAKLDYVPAYQAPTIAGPDTAPVGTQTGYQVSAVGAAQGYQVRQTRLVATNVFEGAESGAGTLTVSVSPGYDIVQSDLVASGSRAFHLAHPPPPPQTALPPQALTFRQLWRAGPDASLKFKSRLSWATPTQIARAQVSIDGGANWQDVWSQPGSDNAGDEDFQARAISLAAFTGRNLNVRFVYEYTGGTFFPQTETGVGMYLDDISVSGVEELLDAAVLEVLADRSFAFNPAIAGHYTLSARAKVSDRFLPWGPDKSVTAAQGTAIAGLSVTGLVVGGGAVQIDFAVRYVNQGQAGSDSNRYFVETAAGAPNVWAADAGAVLERLEPGRYRFHTTTGGASLRFYRVGAR